MDEDAEGGSEGKKSNIAVRLSRLWLCVDGCVECSV